MRPSHSHAPGLATGRHGYERKLARLQRDLRKGDARQLGRRKDDDEDGEK
jgi:hypothetical protein